MAAKVKDITFGVRLDEKGFNSGLDSAEKKIKQVEKQVTKVGNKSASALKKAGGAAKGWGKNFGAALLNPFTTIFAGGALAGIITGGIKGAFDSALQAADVTNRLKSQLDNLGKGASFKGLDELAGKIQSAFNIDDEDIRTGMTTMLRAFSPEQVEGLSALTADLAKSKKMSFAEASEIMTKAVGAGDMRMLKTLGINLTSTGDKAKDAALALQALQKNFGGQAGKIAAGEGPMAGFATAMGELQETIGQSLLPILVPLMQGLTGFLNSLTESGAIKSTFDTIIDFFGQQLEYWKTIWNAIASGNWAELILNIGIMMVQNFIAFIKLAGFGIMRFLVNLMIAAGWKGAQTLLKLIKTMIPKKLGAWLGIDSAIKNVEDKIGNINLIDDETKDAFSDFGKSFMANQRGFIDKMNASNGVTEEATEKTVKTSAQMQSAAEVYSMATTKGMIGQGAIAASQAKTAKEQAKLIEKQRKEAEKGVKAMAKAKMAHGGFAKGGRSGFAGTGGAGYGYLATSGYAPTYGAGMAGMAQMANPGSAVALPEYNHGRGMGDLSSFSGDLITKYGGDAQRMKTEYNKAYLSSMAAAANQNIKVQIYSQQQVHASTVNG